MVIKGNTCLPLISDFPRRNFKTRARTITITASATIIEKMITPGPVSDESELPSPVLELGKHKNYNVVRF